jgi:hypothetical protein
MNPTKPDPEHLVLMFRQTLKGAFVLVWLVATLIMVYVVHADAWFGGTAKQRFFAVAVMTGVPFVVAHFPVRWFAEAKLRASIRARNEAKP